jgi:hypothetical protein
LIGLDAIGKDATGQKPAVQLETPQVRDGSTIRRGRIETEPHVNIPFWLLKPNGEGPFPLAVLPHGHDSAGHDTYAGVYRDEAHRVKSLAEDRDVAVQAVRRGFVAIAPAVRGLPWVLRGRV